MQNKSDTAESLLEFSLTQATIPEKIIASAIILDKNPNTRESLLFRLENEGHRVSIARDEDHVLELLKESERDVLFIDGMSMSLVSDVLFQVCKLPEYTTFIILVGNPDDGALIAKGFERGCDEFIHRPVNPHLLKARVKSGLERRQLALYRHQKLKHIKDAVQEMEDSLVDHEDGVMLLSKEGMIETHNKRILDMMPHLLLEFESQDDEFYLKGISLPVIYHAHYAHQIFDTEAHPDRDNHIKAILERLVKGEDFPQEKLADGRVLSYHVTSSLDDRKILTIKDESAVQGSAHQLAYMAYYDSLTGIVNRQFFTQRLEQLCQQPLDQNFYVMLIDLDGFKAVNDTYGHKMGDWLLIQVAQRLKAALRQGDMAARLGGDEFTIILNKVFDNDIAARVGERILESLCTPFIREDETIHIGASIGISHFSSDSTDAVALLEKADHAMYAVKQAGKNGIRFAKDVVEEELLEVHNAS